jgi:hypothetical protein
MIFSHPANFAHLPDLAKLLGESLVGAIFNEMSAVSTSGPSAPGPLAARLRHVLTRNTDTSSRGHEVRFAERWIHKLERRAQSPLSAPQSVLDRIRPLAVCIYGQMRGFRKVQPNWAKFLADTEYDIYVSTWRQGGRRELIPGRGFSGRVLPERLAQAFDAMCVKHTLHSVLTHFPTLLALLSNTNVVTEQEFRDVYPSLVSARIDDDGESAYAALSTQEKMFLRGKSALDLCLVSGRRYACFAFARTFLSAMAA